MNISTGQCIQHHHEHFDGTGYPDGLRGGGIPLIARIIAVADAFDAMTTNRAYRKGRTAEEAMQELKRCSGSQFDPVIVSAFLLAYEKGNILTNGKNHYYAGLQSCLVHWHPLNILEIC
jgi:HD-GYP domain-containing protein (c-di-GMP phosphodiesterase class II)